MNSHEFSERVLEMEPMLYRMAYGLLLNRTDCADAVQEALLRAWEKRRQLREEAYFRTWLTRILINECYSMLRRRKHAIPLDELPEPVAPPDADRELHDAIAHPDLKRAFGSPNPVFHERVCPSCRMVCSAAPKAARIATPTKPAAA